MDKALKRVYVVNRDGGTTKRYRCPKSIKESVLFLLDRDGSLSRTALVNALGTTVDAIQTALDALHAEGLVQHYKAIGGKRQRLDEYWCLQGRCPVNTTARYRSAETLLAFQAAARVRLTSEVRA
ncbi:hypothetical protein [Burkholderia sp. Bp8990]|uniref:hypothetical protein n=1 Tax=Burkholderia sp. Bp8990 TaxID=2184552 RepID=UPI000F5A78E0|nr:hypothetical protein [Burkholderia sp. Bp8990]RQS39740.1 hypothetical protein DIE01_16110 [Burkholderia sp. Bp8990]